MTTHQGHTRLQLGAPARRRPRSVHRLEVLVLVLCVVVLVLFVVGMVSLVGFEVSFVVGLWLRIGLDDACIEALVHLF